MAKRIREKAAARQANKDTRPSATAKYIRMSSSKAKRILDLIRGKGYFEALAIVQNNASTAKFDVEKVLNSAAANAENNKGLNKDNLYVAECFANPGPTLKRGIWRGKGGHDVILKRTCHITIVLDVVK
jgi:large subunit ribosomal protein L22